MTRWTYAHRPEQISDGKCKAICEDKELANKIAEELNKTYWDGWFLCTSL